MNKDVPLSPVLWAILGLAVVQFTLHLTDNIEESRARAITDRGPWAIPLREKDHD